MNILKNFIGHYLGHVARSVLMAMTTLSAAQVATQVFTVSSAIQVGYARQMLTQQVRSPQLLRQLFAVLAFILIGVPAFSQVSASSTTNDVTATLTVNIDLQVDGGQTVTRDDSVTAVLAVQR